MNWSSGGLLGNIMGGLRNVQMPGQQQGQAPMAPRGMPGGLLGAFGGGQQQGMVDPMGYYSGAQGGMPAPFYRPFTPQAPQNTPQRYVPPAPPPQQQQAAPDIDQMTRYLQAAMGNGFDPGAFRVQMEGPAWRAFAGSE